MFQVRLGEAGAVGERPQIDTVVAEGGPNAVEIRGRVLRRVLAEVGADLQVAAALRDVLHGIVVVERRAGLQLRTVQGVGSARPALVDEDDVPRPAIDGTGAKVEPGRARGRHSRTAIQVEQGRRARRGRQGAQDDDPQRDLPAFRAPRILEDGQRATPRVFHRALGDPNQFVHFLKNLAIAGGLVHIAGVGSGAFSLDGYTSASAP
jgi:putative oxidoreductase